MHKVVELCVSMYNVMTVPVRKVSETCTLCSI